MSARTNLFLAAAAAALAAGPAFAQSEDELSRDEIVVTASPIGRSIQETIIGAQIIDEEALQRRNANTIGELLRREPGVSSTFFGQGASRPVIRGLGGDRISVLDAGIGSIDAAATSPDHAVAVEPATASRVEIVRGTGTLLYGSSAAGGVVNVISGRIPRALPEGGVDGAVRFGGATVNESFEMAGGFDAKLFDLGAGAIVLHGEAAWRDANDYKIPGFEQSTRLREALIADGEAPDDARDKQRSSAYRTRSASVGASFVKGESFAGVSVSRIDTAYDIPGVETEDDGSGPSIDLEQKRIDFDSALVKDLGLFKTARLRVGYGNYAHQEFEPDGEPGTIFENEGWEGRFELVQKDFGGLAGALGLQWRKRDFAAIGDEAFVTPTTSFQWGLFTVQDLTLGDFRLEAGARFESTSHDNATFGARDFDAISFSGGVAYKPSDFVFVGVTGFRTERAPSPEELFSDGLHLATAAFEVGDPDLGVETGRGFEATAKIGGERLSFTVNGFYTSYSDFIFENNSGLTDVTDEGEVLPVLQFIATDATFKGFEAQLEAELFRVGGFDIHGDASLDFVRATADASATGDLPRIPPVHGLFGIDATSTMFDVRAEVEYAGAQNRIGDLELPTDSYTLYNLYLTLRPIKKAQSIALRLSAENLSNEEARTHTSFLKDRVPLPGRNFKVALTASF
jgi:iron complex outermembrane receptor protein